MEKPSRSLKPVAILPNTAVFRFCSWCSYRMVLTLLKIVFPLMFSIKIRGKHRIDGILSAVTVSNHCLYLDPAFAAYAFSPKRLYFTGMEKTFTESKKPFELLIRLLGGFPIPNNNPWKIIEPVKTLFSKNKQALIHFFPEGVMTYRNQRPALFKPGAFLVSQINQVPIIPMVIIIKHRRFWFDKIIIDILDPVEPLQQLSGTPAFRKNIINDQAESVRKTMICALESAHKETV